MQIFICFSDKMADFAKNEQNANFLSASATKIADFSNEKMQILEGYIGLLSLFSVFSLFSFSVPIALRSTLGSPFKP